MGEKKLNLGCGENWRIYKGYDGLDIKDFGQKYVIDALFALGTAWYDADMNRYWLKKEHYDEVMANHFLEHFSQDELKVIFRGIHRILKPGGILKFVVPHKDREEAWDLSHKTFWNENTVITLTTKLKSFGKWKLKELIVNEKKDIHAWLIKK